MIGFKRRLFIFFFSWKISISISPFKMSHKMLDHHLFLFFLEEETKQPLGCPSELVPFRNLDHDEALGNSD